jgi:curli biogenesis system outer membrane secretion channel CsgG
MKQVGAILVLAASLVLNTRAEDKPTVFVAPLDGDAAAIMGWQPALGEGLAEMLITELSKSGKFQVLESTALPELMGEIKLGEAGYVAEGEKVDKGGYAGADFMFRGKVTRFGAQQKGLDLGGFVPKSIGGLGVQQQMADVRIDWRIVDAYNRKVIKTGQSVGQHTGTGFNIGVAVDGHGGNIGFQNHEFMNSALGRATVKALSNIVYEVVTTDLPESGRHRSQAGKQAQQAAQVSAAQVAARSVPGKVLAVPAKSVVIVSLGANQGLKMGDKVLLYQTVDTKDDKGVVVFTEEKLIGELTLETVQDDRSKATYNGDVAVQPGWVVRAK